MTVLEWLADHIHETRCSGCQVPRPSPKPKLPRRVMSSFTDIKIEKDRNDEEAAPTPLVIIR